MLVTAIVVLGLGVLVMATILSGPRIIPNNKCAVVETWRSGKGSLSGGIIALKGEAGYQPEVLRGGIHFRSPLKYRVHRTPLVTIPQGQIGYIFARDGHPLKPNQTLGKIVEKGDNFQSVRGFLTGGGQRGPQRGILREGTYAINLSQFVVILSDTIYYLSLGKNDYGTFKKMSEVIRQRHGFTPVVIRGREDQIGITTVHDGPPLPSGDIIAPDVGSNDGINHNNFQNPDQFLKAGGKRGKQYQVLVDGTYFINRLFATVELIPKTVVPVGFVGVVVSYIGTRGTDSSGTNYKHGELVKEGSKGVWQNALMPGKYPFNSYAGKVIIVPTTNIVLKWISNEIGGHKLDENLRAVDLITKDAFEPSLPLSVVIHIDYRKAPLVIQRFGDVKKLVDQTLDPMVAAYFKNIGQTKTLIQLIQERNEIQKMASDDMQEKFLHYDLELEEVLIGTPASSSNDERIETILVQLRDRQIAEEQIYTFEKQEKAARKLRDLNEARSIASQQTTLTESEIAINIHANKGKAVYERSVQEAAKIRVLATADAEKEARLGIAKALSIEEQVRAYGGPQYQITREVTDRFSQAIENAGVDVVPKMLITGGGDGKSYSAFESLLAMIMSEKMDIGITDAGPRDERISKLKKSILDGIEDQSPDMEKVVT